MYISVWRVKCFIATAMVWRSIRVNYFCFTSGVREVTEKKKRRKEEKGYPEGVTALRITPIWRILMMQIIRSFLCLFSESFNSQQSRAATRRRSTKKLLARRAYRLYITFWDILYNSYPYSSTITTSSVVSTALVLRIRLNPVLKLNSRIVDNYFRIVARWVMN